MQALEFQAYISDGMIKIPFDYSQYKNKKVKIIMLLPDEKDNYNKQELLSAFEEAHSLNIFAEIDNPVEWQKHIRDEWE
jgi:hypothetical protein